MAKKKAAKKAAKKPKEMLLVGSKVKAVIKDNKKMMAGDFLEALNEKVYCLVEGAIARAEANKRSTVRPQDV